MKPYEACSSEKRSLRVSPLNENPALNSKYAAIGNRIFLVTHSPPGFFHHPANMGTSVAICLVFIGCCSNVVFLELLVRSVIETNFSTDF